jgi:hypothetical protein
VKVGHADLGQCWCGKPIIVVERGIYAKVNHRVATERSQCSDGHVSYSGFNATEVLRSIHPSS